MSFTLSLGCAPPRGQLCIPLAMGLSETSQKLLLFLASATEIWADIPSICTGLADDCLIMYALSRSETADEPC